MPPIPIPKSLTNTAAQQKLADIAQQFYLSDEKLHAIVRQFVDDFNLGLSKYGEPMAMIPTFVPGVPDGTETGSFLALDLGGTNLRVCEVRLAGDKTFTLRQKKFKVSEELKTGEATVLFDYMAESVGAFLAENDIPTEEKLHLGLTFSFPVEQKALNSGYLLTWTKGFSAKNAIGKDVVQLLQDAFDRKKVPAHCCALVNDTVGTLMTRGYLTGGCLLGAIFGTGTNGAYIEDVKNIKKLYPNGDKEGLMVVNAEWGAFDNARRVLPVTQFDLKLDRKSINPRFQAFEKFISGMYLGEITRNILLHLIDHPPLKPATTSSPAEYILFGGHSTPTLNDHYGLDSAVLSDVDAAKDPESVRKIIVEATGLKPEQISDTDTEIVQWAVREVAGRAAALSGCAVGAVLVQTQYAKLGGGVGSKTTSGTIDVGVDGSLIEFYPNYEKMLRDSLRVVVGEEVEKKVRIGLAKDGSGVGAALGALQAVKLEKGTV